MQDHMSDCICICALIFFAVGCWSLYTANRTANDYKNVGRTVQSVKNDNKSARQQVRSSAEKIEHAENELDRSIKRTNQVSKRVDQAETRVNNNKRIISGCEDIIKSGRRDSEEARRIFKDIEQTNQNSGTQTGSHT